MTSIRDVCISYFRVLTNCNPLFSFLSQIYAVLHNEPLPPLQSILLIRTWDCFRGNIPTLLPITNNATITYGFHRAVYYIIHSFHNIDSSPAQGCPQAMCTLLWWGGVVNKIQMDCRMISCDMLFNISRAKQSDNTTELNRRQLFSVAILSVSGTSRKKRKLLKSKLPERKERQWEQATIFWP